MTDLRPVTLVTIAGVDTDVVEWSTQHAVDAIGTLSLSLPLPLPAHVTDNATVQVQVKNAAADALRTVFAGSIRADERTFDEGGKWATIRADGWLHLMEFPLIADLAYAGGAGTMPALLIGLDGPVHLGNDTIANYAEDAPRGTKYDATWVPAVDSDFVRFTGRLHGSNSYSPALTNPRVANMSRIELRQGGVALGHVFLPASPDDLGANYNTVEEFGDVGGVWEDFDVTIAGRLVAGVTATARLISGYPPGGGREDFEVQQMRRSTAAKMTARSIIRGLLKHRGFGGVSGLNYVVDEFTSVSGVIIKLGGNGSVDNGQTRLAAGDSPLAFVKRVANLFGYRVFDSPDGICRVRAVRGTPPGDATIDATFTEGVDGLRFRRARDLKPTVNFWRVLGASGTAPDGSTFRYASETDASVPPSNPNIPTNPGRVMGEVSDSLLVSNTLCLYVRNILERNTQDGSTTVEWETWGHPALQPGRVVTVTAPSVGVSGRVWLTGVRHAWSDAGYWTTLTGWTGSGTAFPLSSDPDPAETDITPGTAPPVTRWMPYSARTDS